MFPKSDISLSIVASSALPGANTSVTDVKLNDLNYILWSKAVEIHLIAQREVKILT